MALLGVAFNVKMLAALVCGPALLAGWWLAGSLDWRRRLGWMAAAGATLAVVSLSWSIAFDLTPKDRRPYAGSTQGNSMLELVVLHNGLERFTRTRPVSTVPATFSGIELYDAVPTGPLRLATPALAAQFAWLLPLALAGLFLVRRRDRLQPSLGLWGVWLFTYGVVFSVAGGIFHLYYLSALAPPMAALAGIGAVRLWRRGPGWLAGGLVVCALWQAYIAGASLGWTSPWLAAPALAIVAAAAALWRDKRPPAAAGGPLLMVLPAAWALSAIFAPANLMLPSTSLPRWLGLDDGRGPFLSRPYHTASDDPKLIDFLLRHRAGERFLVAAPTTQLVAPIIMRTGERAMAFAGYFGNEPILTVEAFAEAAKRGEVRYVLLPPSLRMSKFMLWVLENGQPVRPAEWRSVTVPAWRSVTLYDVKPD
jgi:4-amino-4-deoxy-L-arabinose transferase-like glycosyltransferase